MSESNTNQPSKLERNKNSASSDSEEDSDKPKVKTSSSSTTSTDEESSSNKREGRSTFSITSSEGRAKEKPHRLHAREKITLSKHSVPVIHEIQSGHLKPAASPRTSMMVKDMHGAFGAGHNPDPTRLFISPRLHPGERGKPTMTSPESAMSPRKILNLKNHIVEIPMKQPLKLVEQEAVNQFLSPRFENSPRVFEARMIELQAQYERQNASLTKSMLLSFSYLLLIC